MDAIKKIATGGAYEKPAKTKDGALTTQDSDNAHTTEGTSAHDPSIPGTGVKGAEGKVEGKVDQEVDREATSAGVPKEYDSKINSGVNSEMKKI